MTSDFPELGAQAAVCVNEQPESGRRRGETEREREPQVGGQAATRGANKERGGGISTLQLSQRRFTFFFFLCKARAKP
jgi:hypothetical protein